MAVREWYLSDQDFGWGGSFPDNWVKWGGQHSPASIAIVQLWRRSQDNNGPWQGASLQDTEKAVAWWNERVGRLMRD